MSTSRSSSGVRLLALGLIVGIIAGFALGWYSKPAPPPATTTHIKFTLDWAYQGPQAPFLVALYKGFFAEEGLSVTIDRGYGSARVISDVASGLFDMGFGDINSLIEFKSNNPGAKVKMVATVHVGSPLSVVTLKSSGISSPKDLEGKRLGAPAGDAARRVFPAYARVVGIDPTKVTWVTMDVALREPMLVRGDVDAITGFYYTCILNLLSLNISERDIVTFKYDAHLPLIGNGIVVNEDFLKNNPEAVRKFIKAFIKGLKYSIQNPDEAISILTQRDPTLNKEVEKKRLMMALEIINVKGVTDRYGFGYVEPSVIERNIDVIVSAFGLSRKPSLSEVIDFSYLPPQEQRLP
ncbi:MAG: ABC transporter substrate-binding protein [Sulfolobales archaeon]|nr:ABC transporter substrate-binding protein [Sulfolobales archaeon]MCX8185990.1 ABC transporter substrate-binding protein [Sulfolobales archaeon]MDW7969247.1 ABC transporter substrate-binding protein [Sulfolobales archaeon]